MEEVEVEVEVEVVAELHPLAMKKVEEVVVVEEEEVEVYHLLETVYSES
jgi:hypothetical protein